MFAIPLPWLVNRYTIGIAVAVGLIVGGYAKGHHDAASACHDGELRAQIASMQRDIAAAAAAEDTQKKLADKLAATNADLQQQVTAYETELASRTAPACRLDQRDADRLRGVKGR